MGEKMDNAELPEPGLYREQRESYLYKVLAQTLEEETWPITTAKALFYLNTMMGFNAGRNPEDPEVADTGEQTILEWLFDEQGVEPPTAEFALDEKRGCMWPLLWDLSDLARIALELEGRRMWRVGRGLEHKSWLELERDFAKLREEGNE